MAERMCIPIVAVAVVLAIGPTASVGQTVEDGGERSLAKSIQWSLLAPENGKPFTDPFSKLTRDQLEQLSYVVRARRLAYEGKISADGVDAMKSVELSRKLKKEGVDIGWLLAQRDRVRQYRKLQIDELSKDIAATLSGGKVTLTGYVIPIKADEGQLTEFFLVPSVAACSHESAPPRLQVVFVTAESGIIRPDAGVPVRITGNVEARTTTGTISNGNGQTPIRSAYAIRSAKIETYHASRQ